MSRRSKPLRTSSTRREIKIRASNAMGKQLNPSHSQTQAKKGMMDEGRDDGDDGGDRVEG